MYCSQEGDSSFYPVTVPVPRGSPEASKTNTPLFVLMAITQTRAARVKGKTMRENPIRLSYSFKSQPGLWGHTLHPPKVSLSC